MAQRTSRVRRRALIVEDEPLFAMGLVADMHGLGFADCELAADGQQAFLKATSKKPDIVLMDVNLDGEHDGIEAARWLRCAVCDIPIVITIPSNASINRCQMRRLSPSLSIVSALLAQ